MTVLARQITVPQRPVVDLVMLRFDTPPSSNSMFKNVLGKGRVRTNYYNEWRQGAMSEILAQRPGRVPGRYGISVLVRHTSRRSDLENRLKGVSDILVTMGVIDDDRYCDALEMSWTDDPEITGVEVRIWAEAGAR